MSTTARFDECQIQVDSEGDPKTVTVFATTLTVPPTYLVASGAFDTPLDVPAAIDSLRHDLDVTFV